MFPGWGANFSRAILRRYESINNKQAMPIGANLARYLQSMCVPRQKIGITPMLRKVNTGKVVGDTATIHRISIDGG